MVLFPIVEISDLNASAVQIKSLIEKLEFITDKKRWGEKFRFGAFEISKTDFLLIASEMNVDHIFNGVL